jgi:hypothetical protein
MSKHHVIGWLSSAALLAGCGGGSSDSMPAAPAATEAVAASASTSASGLATYLGELANMPVDNKEPVDLSNFTPPTPDNTEPEPVK